MKMKASRIEVDARIRSPTLYSRPRSRMPLSVAEKPSPPRGRGPRTPSWLGAARAASVRPVLLHRGVQHRVDEARVVQALALVALDEEVVPAGADQVAGHRVERGRSG